MAFSRKEDTIGNVELVKQLNSAIVYRLIAQQGPISRSQIAEKSQLAPASVTKITRQFLQAGLIKEVELQSSTGGRPPISIKVKTHHLHTIAIHLSRKNITIELYNLAGKSLAYYQTPSAVVTQKELQQKLIQTIESFIVTHQRIIKTLIAISIVMPGLIDNNEGIVKYIPNIKIHEWKIRKILHDHFKLPCFIGHNMRALALAEHYFGATQHCDDSILIRVHRGVGAGIIINRSMFLGKNNFVAEIGHIQVNPLGERCQCGNFGCLESIVSNDALRQRVTHLLKQGRKSSLSTNNCDINAICLAANNKDQLAIEIIELAAFELGKVIAMMLNILNPQKVVITGDIILSEALLFPAMKAIITQHTLTLINKNIILDVSQLNHRSAIGAFALVRQALFNGELLMHLLK